MRNWLVGRHNEVYRIVNAHNWPCLVKHDKCTRAVGCELLQASLRIVGEVMPMCAFAKKLSLTNMQDDLQSLSNLLNAYHNKKKKDSAILSLLFELDIDKFWNF